MTEKSSTTGSNLSDNLICPLCDIQLPSLAVFCSSCGERVKQQEKEEPETHVKPSSDEAQQQESKTIRVARLPQLYLERWLSYQSQKNRNEPVQLQESSSSLPGGEQVSAKPTSSSQEIASADEIVSFVPPIHIEQTQDSPSVPAPSLSEIQEQTSIRSNVLWPALIILSAFAAGLVNFEVPHIALRPIIVFWFLFVCPGMVVVRFLRLKKPVVEWTLAVALSFAVEAVLAGIQDSSGRWNPAATLALLIGFCFIGSAIQLAKMIPRISLKVYPVTKAMKRRTANSVPLPEDSSPIEPPVLTVSEVSTQTRFPQRSLSDQSGQTDPGSLWSDMDIEMRFSQSDWIGLSLRDKNEMDKKHKKKRLYIQCTESVKYC